MAGGYIAFCDKTIFSNIFLANTVLVAPRDNRDYLVPAILLSSWIFNFERMQIMKRIFLFILTNILVMVTITTVINLLGLKPYMTSAGIDYQSLMIFCLIWGMGGAFISLQMSRWTAKQFMGVKVIDPNNPGQYGTLVNMIKRVCQSAGLNTLPEIGVYQSNNPNAFATGPSKSRSLVAFSSGLLNTMSDQEVEGVAAHEIAHIQNGDMVTMTLLQGVMNAFVMFFARIIAYAVSQNVKEESRYMVNFLVTIGLEILFGILGMIVVASFSRYREFRADAGAARYSGREKMVAALKKLGSISGRLAPEEHASIAALKINGQPSKFFALFSTHPPLAERIRKLETNA